MKKRIAFRIVDTLAERAGSSHSSGTEDWHQAIGGKPVTSHAFRVPKGRSVLRFHLPFRVLPTRSSAGKKK